MKSAKLLLLPVASVILSTLPFVFTRIIGRIAGLLFYLVDAHKRQAFATNFRYLFSSHTTGSKSINSYVRKTFENFVLASIGFMQIHRFTRQQLMNLVETRGQKFLTQALAQCRGVLLVSPHLGDWELACYVTAKMGYPLVVAAEPISPEHSQALGRFRRWSGLEVVMRTEPIKMLNALKRNKILLLAGDRDFAGTGIELPFFAGRRSIPRGPATLALRTGAVLLVGYFVLNPGQGKKPYLGVIEPPVEYASTGNRDRDVNRLTEILTDRLCRAIQTYPDQWFVYNSEWR
jgi:KDO2-lipid IV(A) lauroyltransferase